MTIDPSAGSTPPGFPDVGNLVQIEDAQFYDSDAHEIFARLRRENPVHWYQPLDTWVVTRYADIRLVGSHPEVFSSAQGISLNDARFGGKVTTTFFGGPKAELLSAIDPPRHREQRRIVAAHFTAPRARDMKPTIRELARRLVDEITPEVSVPFVSQVAAVLPLQVIALLMGLPPEDSARLKAWTDEMVKMADVRDAAGLEDARRNAAPMQSYLDEWIVRHLGEEGTELIPCLVDSLSDGSDTLTYENMHMFLSLILVAGNQTTRNFISGSVLTYAQFPDQLEILSKHGELAAAAGEECLRWVTPVRSKMRTIVRSTTLGEQALEPGQRVLLMYMSANRDEQIWERADLFDIKRPRRSTHLAFGFGEHACLGAALARLEGQVLMEELTRRFSTWELAGEPIRHPSELHNSLDELPVVFRRPRF